MIFIMVIFELLIREAIVTIVKCFICNLIAGIVLAMAAMTALPAISSGNSEYGYSIFRLGRNLVSHRSFSAVPCTVHIS